MHRDALIKVTNAILSAGRGGADVPHMDRLVSKHPHVPYGTVTELATAAREAGVTSEDLNIAQIELEPENRDRDPVRDLVADVFEQSPSEEE